MALGVMCPYKRKLSKHNCSLPVADTWAYRGPQWVGMDIVPKEYGGQAEAVPVEVALRRLQQQEAKGNASSNSSGQGVQALTTGVAGEALLVRQTCRLCAVGECRCGWQKVAQGEVLSVAAA